MQFIAAKVYFSNEFFSNQLTFSTIYKSKVKLAEHHLVVTRRPSPIHNPLGLDMSFKAI